MLAERGTLCSGVLSQANADSSSEGRDRVDLELEDEESWPMGRGHPLRGKSMIQIIHFNEE